MDIGDYMDGLQYPIFTRQVMVWAMRTLPAGGYAWIDTIIFWPIPSVNRMKSEVTVVE
jgi:hypothetical protein